MRAFFFMSFIFICASNAFASEGLNDRDNIDPGVFKGVFLFSSSPAEKRNLYSIYIFGKYNYRESKRCCPRMDVFASVIGEGDPPEMSSFHIGGGYGWKFLEWSSFPEVPLFDTDDKVIFKMSRIGPNNEREEYTFAIGLDGVRRIE